MTLTPARIAELRRLIAAATPLEDTGHGLSCQCAECLACWAHGAGRSEALFVLMPQLPELLSAADEANRLRALLADARRWVFPFDKALLSRIDDALSSPTTKAGK